MFYAENVIKMHVRHKYEDPDDSTSEIFKTIGLELGAWHVYDKHFNEQDTLDGRKFWQRRQDALGWLKDVAKGLLSTDAASVETSRQEISFGVNVDSDGDPLDRYSESEVSGW